jgi:Undecaprenyl-phosphate galactose phosphotransferase WbaP
MNVVENIDCPTVHARPSAVQSHRIPASVAFAICDVVLIELIIVASILLRKLIAPILPIDLHPSTFEGVQIGALVLSLAYALGGLYPGYGITSVQRLRLRVSLTALCFSAMVLFDYLAQKGQWSRGVLIIAGTLSVVILPIWDSLIVHLFIRLRLWGIPVVVLGPTAQRHSLLEALRRQPELGWLPIAEADTPDALPAVAKSANLAIVADPGQSLSLRDIEDLPFRKVVLIPNVESAQNLWVSVRDLGSFIGLEMRRNLLMPTSQIIKRVLDIAAATILTVPVGLVILFFATALQLVSPGPIFFTQLRGGKADRGFKMIKLRTMVPDAETHLQALLAVDQAARQEWSHSMKLRQDPRIVPIVGEFMRRFSIDELPQLWNVLRGDMSLVGPRPLPDYHLAALEPDARRLRLRVRPGVTGLWQVSGRSELALDEQQRLDNYYVRNWSLWLDIHILGRTTLAVLRGRGAR